MEFWLGLSKTEVKRRLVRQRRLRRGFFALGLLFLAAQGVLIVQGRQARAQEAQLSPALPAAAGLALPLKEPGQNPAIPATVTPTTEEPGPVAKFHVTDPAIPTTTPGTSGRPDSTSPTSPTLPLQEPGQNPAIPASTPALTLTLTATPTTAAATPPTLLSPPHTAFERYFRLEGTGRPGSVVTVYYERSLIARAGVDPTGRWLVEVPTAPLVRGENRLRIAGGGLALTLDLTFEPWWLDVPQRLQGALGEGFACAPTVLGMALDYYHGQDPDLPAPATTELVRALRSRGFVDGYGADAQMLVDLAIDYGYSHSYFYRNWTQAHLRQALDAGTPVVANVRAEMSTDGYGHSVLIIGLSPDGRRVMVHDPAQGMVEYAWTTFDRSWGSFGPPYRHGMVVKP